MATKVVKVLADTNELGIVSDATSIPEQLSELNLLGMGNDLSKLASAELHMTSPGVDNHVIRYIDLTTEEFVTVKPENRDKVAEAEQALPSYQPILMVKFSSLYD